jgi:hypothetical protein
MQFPSQNSMFLCNCLDGPLKVSRLPAVSRSFRVEDVRTLEQHRPNDRSSFSNFYTELDFSSRHCLGSFCKMSGRRGNTSGRCPTFQDILNFRSIAERRYSEDHPDTRAKPSGRILVMERFALFWKAVAEDRPDAR